MWSGYLTIILIGIWALLGFISFIDLYKQEKEYRDNHEKRK